MTKREFFENVLKMKPSDIGTAIPFNPNGETEVTEEWLISFIKNLLAERSNWHTGTPTEKGLYVVLTKVSMDGVSSSEGTYILDYWDGCSFQYLKRKALVFSLIEPDIYSWVKWLKIEEK